MKADKETVSPPLYFSQLGLQRVLQNNLDQRKFLKLSPIQAYCIPELLRGNNVFGLARVGSGKTLSFVVPMIQKLLEKRWTQHDGLGGLIITPTRELGMQIFTVLNQVARGAQLSCGMVCGGHDQAKERQLLQQMNVLVATPGRLVQHLEELHGTIGDQLQMLVFDEVDALLEQGFLKQVKEIADYFPQPVLLPDGTPTRVTAFFSATESPRVQSILKYVFGSEFALVSKEVDAEFVRQNRDFTAPAGQRIQALTGKSEYLPAQLQITQVARVVTAVQEKSNLTAIISQVHPADKLDTLFSFMRSFPAQKGIVFFSTCAQTGFVFDAFRKLGAGAPLWRLASKMSQNQRQETFYEFRKASQGYLLTTDVAARGIDITDIAVVVQYDCPTDVSEYTHRCGRATRMGNPGMSILFLAAQENTFKQQLKKAGQIFEEKFVKLKHAVSVRSAIALTLASDPSLRTKAEKALNSYYKSLVCQRNKAVFNPDSYDFSQIAKSFGIDVAVEKVAADEETPIEKETKHRDESSEESDLLIQKEPGQQEAQKDQDNAADRGMDIGTAEKLDRKELIQRLGSRISALQGKVGKNDQKERLQYNQLMKKIREGVSEDSDAADVYKRREQLETAEEGFEEEWGEEGFETEEGEEEPELVEWQEPEKM